MMGILVSLDIFIIKNSSIVSIFVKVLFCTGASISLGYIEEGSLSLRVSAFFILIHTIKMSVRKTVQICSHSNIAWKYCLFAYWPRLKFKHFCLVDEQKWYLTIVLICLK